MTSIKKLFNGVIHKLFNPITSHIENLNDLVMHQVIANRVNTHPNPFCKYGKKYFSQADEDGITLEILKRLELSDGVFAEIGVGDGLENNTLILIAHGWKGFWLGGEALAFEVPADNKNFAYIRKWITVENIVESVRDTLKVIGQSSLDVISLDLDGNDIFIINAMLAANIKPKLFIVEYNAKIPPDVFWKIKYDPNHHWMGDDYFGASLGSFVKLFEQYGYKLICCNSQSGANAFFVDHKFISKFPEVPSDIEKIYTGPFYHQYKNFGHRKSPKTIERLFVDNTK